ncbi:MAG: bifunctional diaminohydroxyphosphoribosylaminopyrimidine deaminase/5-amino-6-(5-phosphoribosylamino)uracil reductase RibD [Phycisphaerales bacterium]|nr:bifunctional diaminohydroxyphosphoribosylaminopyrimidine deaminase/5-amino-6-(5-phosphoribosylamino)uracil reductase RibD [Phycisphaerales bacterium]
MGSRREKKQSVKPRKRRRAAKVTARVSSTPDERFMRRALELAALHQGFVEPNPMVGCVIVKQGRVIGEGAHERYGGPHAEVNALRFAGVAARGATVYVNLEPCAHHGKTPPCAEALIRAGATRVVAAMRDPFELVQGRGFDQLRQAGIRVDIGTLAGEAAALNAPFLKRVQQGRPWVILKWAQSIDGRIATRSGDSKWISDEICRAHAHEVRGRVDAIVVGVNTVLRDDPMLTCRLAAPRRVARRIVLDTDLRTPPDCALARSAHEVETWVVCGDLAAHRARAAALRKAGVHVESMSGADGCTNIEALLTLLGTSGATNVLVEGGGRVIGEFFERQLGDEIHAYIAPLLIGGDRASGPLRGRGAKTVQEALRLPRGCTMRPLGDGWIFQGRLW